jgi:hypothetical protein
MESPIIHILITVFVIPVCFMVFQRIVNKNDELKKDSEDRWREEVKGKFDSISKKITSFCQDNHNEHNELYAKSNDLTSRVGAIETIHQQRGCNQPYNRRGGE